MRAALTFLCLAALAIAGLCADFSFRVFIRNGATQDYTCRVIRHEGTNATPVFEVVIFEGGTNGAVFYDAASDLNTNQVFQIESDSL